MPKEFGCIPISITFLTPLSNSEYINIENVKKIIRLDGVGIPAILKAIMPLLPLDTFVDKPAILMQPNADFGREPSVWSKYKNIIEEHQKIDYEYLERFKFYDRCKNVYAIVSTSELEIYANIILKKGVVLFQ